MPYPGKADRNAAGYKAGKKAGPQGGNKIGDHVKNGPAAGPIIFPKCVDEYLFGDGVHRRFFVSATIDKSNASNVIIFMLQNYTTHTSETKKNVKVFLLQFKLHSTK